MTEWILLLMSNLALCGLMYFQGKSSSDPKLSSTLVKGSFGLAVVNIVAMLCVMSLSTTIYNVTGGILLVLEIVYFVVARSMAKKKPTAATQSASRKKTDAKKFAPVKKSDDETRLFDTDSFESRPKTKPAAHTRQKPAREKRSVRPQANNDALSFEFEVREANATEEKKPEPAASVTPITPADSPLQPLHADPKPKPAIEKNTPEDDLGTIQVRHQNAMPHRRDKHHHS